MGTKDENESQSDTGKQDLNEFAALQTAMFEGKQDEVDRLMAAEKPADDTETPPEKEEEAPDSDTVEDEDTEETPEDEEKPEGEGGSDPLEEEGKPDTTKEAAPAASTATPNESLEELRQKLHRAQSDAGRVPYLQRRMAELERELRATKARSTEDATQDKKPSTKRVEDVELDEETQTYINDLKEIDPVLAKTIERSTKAAIFAATAKVDHAVTTLTDEEQRAEDDRFYIEQKSILAQRIPQHEQIFATPEWTQWKASLTPGQRALAESAYANEVEQAIYAFAADMKRAQGGDVSRAPEKKEETPPVSETPNEVEKTRERKIGTAAGTRAPAAKTTKELDADAYFKEIHAQLLKENHIKVD